MSIRSEYILSLTGLSFETKSREELQSYFNKVLKVGMHGLCFSPYAEEQEPGSIITIDQIRKKLEIIRPYTQWIRTFSCTDGNELIPEIAREYGFKTLVGAWLGENERINDQEVANAIKIAKEGKADILAIGNEVMYRDDLSEEELLNYLKRVKSEVPNVPVSYVDAYYEFENRPKITEACDLILANCYPFWEGCNIEYSLLYMKDMYNRALKAANGKKVIISETGWPNIGEAFHGAEPSNENAIRYFINTQLWSKEDDIDIFYFSSFDEPWKIHDEGDVGAFWGLWDKDCQLKY
ncbi:MAG: glycosyl hydrolase [Marinilabiliales bacterium]|jgi:exo-beta-1,3-glucanase (GH17 family)|nr:MAG: glycosyl hydrolase [Marinilabiliales bacterium]